MNLELQGLWACPSPWMPDTLDYYHFHDRGRVVTFTPHGLVVGQRMAIRYWLQEDTGETFQLRLRFQDQPQSYVYHFCDGKLVIRDAKRHQWVLSRLDEPEIPDWFTSRLQLEHERMNEAEQVGIIS
ncbi:hypothetical protein EI77_00844 [Prosthecobacter fusiformis]|uniref:Uncharacterized protein n=1 Tax=Prosthecobacter fusiformis TaxID=48464 RepID=A0A4R7SRE1_9BACT|nr:hypothetical protein [Prosthecobacter fusiformis]TDU81534.1 hypothetical protein EI77_00844 [Prosthecobacter fusiformis]